MEMGPCGTTHHFTMNPTPRWEKTFRDTPSRMNGPVKKMSIRVNLPTNRAYNLVRSETAFRVGG